MAKKKADAGTIQRFESALRRALNTPPGAPRKKAKTSRGKKKTKS